MVRLAVTGYASLDYPVLLDGMVEADRTTHIRFRDPDAWPRAGGSPTYVAAAAAKAGVSAAPVTWVGDDALSEAYVAYCRHAGATTEAIVRCKGERSPAALMIHQGDGSTACLYDPGLSGRESLSPDQARLIAEAQMLCVTVGPGHLIGAILDARPAERPLCWVMKDDPKCFDAANRAALARRASVIFCNRAERALVDVPPGRDALVVETHGAEGMRLEGRGIDRFLAARPVAATDPTGAGDSFAGAFIAAHMNGMTPEQAAQSAMDSVRAMLLARAESGPGRAGGTER